MKIHNQPSRKLYPFYRSAVRIAITVILLLFASASNAQKSVSNACSQINNAWGNGQSVELPIGATDTKKLFNNDKKWSKSAPGYGPFKKGETLSWDATGSFTGSFITNYLVSIANYVSGGTLTNEREYYTPSRGPFNFATQNSVTFEDDSTHAYLEIRVNNNTGKVDNVSSAKVTLTATCTSTGVVRQPVTLTPAGNSSLPSGTVGTAYSDTSLSAEGGEGKIKFSASGLPSGLTMDEDGKITGTPSTSGTFRVEVTAAAATSGSATASYDLTISPAPVVLSPATGMALTGGTVGTVYKDASLSAKGGMGQINFTAKDLPDGLTVDEANGQITGTPTRAGTFIITVTAAAANSSSATASYTIVVAEAPVFIAPLVLLPATNTVLSAGTVGTVYSDVSLSTTGGEGMITFSAPDLPPGLTLDASSGKITGTPTAAETFTVNVTAKAATFGSATARYTIVVVAAPVIITPVVLSPATGTALTGGTVGTVYNEASLSAKGGKGAITFSAEGLPAGLTMDKDSGKITGTPTQKGSFTFDVTAKGGTSGSATARYTIVVAAAPVVIMPLVLVPATNTALSGGTVGSPYNDGSLSAEGGEGTITFAAPDLPPGLTLDASNGKITGTPTAAGTFTVNVTAKAATFGSATARYTIVVAAAPVAEPPVEIKPIVLSPASGAVIAPGTVGTPYSSSVSASGGAGAYLYAVSQGALPPGLILDQMTGAVLGTPSKAGDYSFTITATDQQNPVINGFASYTMTIKAVPEADLVLLPAGGALPKAMAGEDYKQSISTMAGSAPFLYSLAGGQLPEGLVLNISTGELTGPLSAGSQGDYAFTLKVQDANGATGTASYSLTVTARTVSVADKQVTVPAGATPNDVYLNRGATGGPFISAELTFVDPPQAGTAVLIRGQVAQAASSATPVGWYLQFTPNPAYSGQVRVGFRLTSSLGMSNTGTVTYNLGYNADRVTDNMNGLARDFVRSRQNMLSSSISVPGLLERRRMADSPERVTTQISPSETGMTLAFSTSLHQLHFDGSGMRDDAATSEQTTDLNEMPFNIWIDGRVLMHNRSETDKKWGSFAMVSVGADYLVTHKALLGFSVHYDRMTDPVKADTELTGNGWLAGPYASVEVGDSVFWNTSLLYGGSANIIDTPFWDGRFDTARFLADTSMTGDWDLDASTTLTPKLRAVYITETAKDYDVNTMKGDTVDVKGFTEEQLRVSLGAEIARRFALDNGATLTPKLGATTGYAGIRGSGAFGSLTAGLALATTDDWLLDFGLLFNLESDGEKSAGAKALVSKRF